MDDGIGQHVIEMPGLATQRQTDRQTDTETQRQINLGQAPTRSSFEGDFLLGVETVVPFLFLFLAVGDGVAI